MRFFLVLAAAILTDIAKPFASDAMAHQMENLCDLCICHGRELHCDYRYNKTLSRIFDEKYFLPPHIMSICVNLADRTEFELRKGVLRQNVVNSIVIDGHNGSNQVELTADVLAGNLGGYPDFQIRNVRDCFLRAEAFSNSESKLKIENNGYVVLDPNCFKNMNMSCTLTNIDKLVINEKNYNPSTDRSSHIKLFIKNSYIDKINRIDSSINSIELDNCTINNIQSDALDVTHMNKISFNSCNIGTIKTMAITNKLLSQSISFTGNRIGTIHTNAIMGSGTSAFTFSNNTVERIMENGITVYCVDAAIEYNRFKTVGRQWLSVNNYEQISISNNDFDDFTAVQLDNVDNRKRTNCTFVKNSFKFLAPKSLNFSCEMRSIIVARKCHCDDIQEYLPTLTDHDISSELYCQLPNQLSNCFKTKVMHLRRYANDVCGVKQTLHCPNGIILERYSGIFMTKDERERMLESSSGQSIKTIVFIVIVSIVVLIIICLCLVVLCSKKKNTSQDFGRPLSPQDQAMLQNELKRLSSAGDNNVKIIKLIKKLLSHKYSTDDEFRTDLSELCHEPRLSVDIRNRMTQHLNLICCNSQQTPTAPIESATEHIYNDLVEYGQPSDQLIFNPAIADDDDMPPAYEASSQYATPIGALPSFHVPSTSAAGHYHELPDVLYTYQSSDSVCYATPVYRLTANGKPISPPPRPVPVQPPELPEWPELPAQRHVCSLREDLEAMPQFHPNQLTSPRNQSQLQSRYPNSTHTTHPTHNNNSSSSSNNNNNNNRGKRKRSFECLDGAASLAAMELMDIRGAPVLPMDTNSDHSGGSDETVKIDDIQYVDA